MCVPQGRASKRAAVMSMQETRTTFETFQVWFRQRWKHRSSSPHLGRLRGTGHAVGHCTQSREAAGPADVPALMKVPFDA